MFLFLWFITKKTRLNRSYYDDLYIYCLTAQTLYGCSNNIFHYASYQIVADTKLWQIKYYNKIKILQFHVLYVIVEFIVIFYSKREDIRVCAVFRSFYDERWDDDSFDATNTRKQILQIFVISQYLHIFSMKKKEKLSSW